MMKPPIETWGEGFNPAQTEGFYPFAGHEVLLTILATVVWLAWTIWQFRSESADLASFSARRKRPTSPPRE